MQFPLDIKAWHFEGSSSWCRNPELKSPMWDLDISLLGNILSNGDYLCFWVTYPEVSSWLHYISIPFTHFTVVSSSYLSYRKKKISAVLQVILIDSCYINNCNLGVSIERRWTQGLPTPPSCPHSYIYFDDISESHEMDSECHLNSLRPYSLTGLGVPAITPGDF